MSNEDPKVQRRHFADIALDVAADLLVRSVSLVQVTAAQEIDEQEARLVWLIDNYLGWSPEGTFTFPDGYTLYRDDFGGGAKEPVEQEQPIPPKDWAEAAEVNGSGKAPRWLGSEGDPEPMPDHIPGNPKDGE